MTGQDDTVSLGNSLGEWRKLEAYCVDRLKESIGDSPRVFNRQLRDAKWDATIATEDFTSTSICIIGLTRSGHTSVIDAHRDRILQDMFTRSRDLDYPGGFGLALWANAVYWGLDFKDMATGCGVDFSKTKELLNGFTTMETAWLVSGLLHQGKIDNSDTLTRVTDEALDVLKSRYNADARVFFHADSSAPVGKRLRRNVPNFADQIYSIQAMAFAGLARGDAALSAIAAAGADQMCELQGTLGQWWWHYDARRGEIAKSYPVYSVHQHAMAPMALMAVMATGAGQYSQNIEKSVAWIHHNEASQSMVDQQMGTIWRDIEPPVSRIGATVSNMSSVIGIHSNTKTRERTEGFVINQETRPYEWGWCLYAMAIAESRAQGSHLV